MIGKSALAGAIGIAGVAILGAVFGVARYGSKSAQDIEPDSAPGEKAVLDFGGPRVPVEVEYHHNGTEVELDLRSDGFVLETEKYLASDKEFALSAAAEERFSPPLPLLKYPFKLGDRYDWHGRLTYAGSDRSASAEITTTAGKLTAEGHELGAILVEAKVALDGGGEKPAIRDLKFWIVMKRGVLQREFGEGVKRQPL
jgi:hypothetical protein